MSDTEPQTTVDPHNLIASGEPLATLHELAHALGAPFSVTAVRMLLNGRLLQIVRHCRARPGPARVRGVG